MQTPSQISQLFADYLATHAFRRAPIELYEPADYIMSLGGKRLRPALLLMSYALFNDEGIEKALPAAMAIEVFHNFTLVHDDIMDEAPLRRGQPTIHVKYGGNTAILSGDVMLIAAYEFLMQLNDRAKIIKILDIFNKTAREVCEGQQLDMNFEKSDTVTAKQYLYMIGLKTSVLVAGAMQIGALLGGASAKDARLMYDFGYNLGVAFQLQDDFLDVYGDPEKFGKKVGGDIVQNKKTYLLLNALQKAKGVTKKKLHFYLSNVTEEAEKIQAVTEIYTQLGIPELSETIKSKYQSLAFQKLQQVTMPDERKNELRKLAEEMLGRVS
jgi:geranylgeranyl diphosphate synthase, type II